MISIEASAAWLRDGFVLVPGFLNPEETIAVTSWVVEISAWPDDADRWMHHREIAAEGIRLCRTENFMPYHEGMKQLLTEGKTVAAVSRLIGGPAVLYKEKINYKYPGGGGYAAHQDAPAYDHGTEHVTCLIAVDACTPDNGCLFFAPGRHRDGLLAMDDKGCIAPDVAERLDWRATPTQPGDALFFSSFAPHLSPPNHSRRSRRALYLTYNAASEGGFRDSYYREKRESLAARELSNGVDQGRISKIGHFQGNTVLAKQ